MRILLRKFHGALCAFVAGGTAGRVTLSASPPMAGLLDASMHANMLALTWLVILAAPLALLLGVLALLTSGGYALPDVAAAPAATVDPLALVAFAGITFTPYDTAELTGVINSLIGLKNGLHATFFSAEKTSEAETIVFDIDEKKRYQAPYVHPKSPGKPTDLRGFKTSTFSPAYIKQLTTVDPNRALKRMKGEALLGDMDPQARLDAVVTQELADHREYIDRRLEEQALSALKTGQVTVTGENYPTTVVDFGRDASLNEAANTLGGASLWSAGTADPLKNFRAWSKKAVKLSGSILRNFIMDSDAYDAFRSLDKIDKQFNVLRADPGKLNLNEAQNEGLILRGECDGHYIWTYDAFYTDNAGVEQNAISGGYVLGVGAIDGVTHFGAIKDFKAGLKAVPIFAKSWEEENPSGMMLLTQSAPLVVPQRINASLCAKVL